MIAAWAAFFLTIAVAFAALETYALKRNKPTLSRAVWIASHNFPLLPFLVGLAVGILACHFWWGGIVHFEPVP